MIKPTLLLLASVYTMTLAVDTSSKIQTKSSPPAVGLGECDCAEGLNDPAFDGFWDAENSCIPADVLE